MGKWALIFKWMVIVLGCDDNLGDIWGLECFNLSFEWNEILKEEFVNQVSHIFIEQKLPTKFNSSDCNF
jgi:hypothetical protein